MFARYRAAWVPVVGVAGLAVAFGGALITEGESSDVEIRVELGWWFLLGGMGLVVLYGVVFPLFAMICVLIRDVLLNFVEIADSKAGRRGARSFEVLHANCGGVDVTGRLQQRTLNGHLAVRASHHDLNIADPTPNVRKTLSVKYRRPDGREAEITVDEDDTLQLP